MAWLWFSTRSVQNHCWPLKPHFNIAAVKLITALLELIVNAHFSPCSSSPLLFLVDFFINSLWCLEAERCIKALCGEMFESSKGKREWAGAGSALFSCGFSAHCQWLVFLHGPGSCCGAAEHSQQPSFSTHAGLTALASWKGNNLKQRARCSVPCS